MDTGIIFINFYLFLNSIFLFRPIGCLWYRRMFLPYSKVKLKPDFTTFMTSISNHTFRFQNRNVTNNFWKSKRVHCYNPHTGEKKFVYFYTRKKHRRKFKPKTIVSDARKYKELDFNCPPWILSSPRKVNATMGLFMHHIDNAETLKKTKKDCSKCMIRLFHTLIPKWPP